MLGKIIVPLSLAPLSIVAVSLLTMSAGSTALTGTEAESAPTKETSLAESKTDTSGDLAKAPPTNGKTPPRCGDGDRCGPGGEKAPPRCGDGDRCGPGGEKTPLPAPKTTLKSGGGHGTSGPCQDLSGAAFGLCTAFCEAQECHLEDPFSTSCQMLYDNYVNQTGEEPPCIDPCFVPESDRVDYEVSIMLTADDSYQLYVDGVDVTSDATYPNNWFRGDTLTYTLESGCHTLAVAASDTYSVTSGFIASVSVDGVLATNTGDGEWLASDSNPGPGWTLVGFDDSSMFTEQPCASSSIWGTYWPAPFYAVGASWVWGNTACGNLGEAFFRLNMDLP